MSQAANGQYGGTLPTTADEAEQDLIEYLSESNLSAPSKDVLRNHVVKDVVMAFLSPEEVHEYKWKLRQKREAFFAYHPAPNCEVTGDDRAYINDDSGDKIEPLSEKEEYSAQTFFDMAETLITRAKEMKQQEMMNTRIEERRAKDNRGDDDSSGIIGRLSG